jgi:hypothetical protein
MSENLFILGSPRSGTTFLASLLGPTKFGEPFESQFIIKYNKRLSTYGDITSLARLSRLVTDIASERAVLQWDVRLSAEEIKGKLGGVFTYADVVNEICLKLLATKGKEFWGDKTPHYLSNVNELVELFPNAKFIYIVRDGRDVALSLLKKNWGPNNVYACADEWAKNNGSLDAINELENRGKLIQIQYENLLDHTVEECSKIYQFLGEDIGNSKPAMDKLLKSTIAGNYGKWRNIMSKKDIEIFESVAGKCLNLHNYEVISHPKKISGFVTLYYKAHDKCIYWKNMFVLNVIDTIKIKFFNKKPFSE